MSKMRGVEPFPAITDLVNAKKTQRDKDWPMIARLVRAHYYQHRENSNAAQIELWLRELRDAPLLREASAMFPDAARRSTRAAVEVARIQAADEIIEAALQTEQARERALDREY